jgi:hypothetical protein
MRNCFVIVDAPVMVARTADRHTFVPGITLSFPNKDDAMWFGIGRDVDPAIGAVVANHTLDDPVMPNVVSLGTPMTTTHRSSR